ncbi:MAG TPA: tRNA lysidine(34) synthetase TilS [Marmoricola sp.]|jgi:tRNA(Ile)-lysidine synthase|nr:tRNA lysidine(34) synthetase TilS [Marmoricola sp.]
MALAPALAAVRLAVRRDLQHTRAVMVACSGGADSLALLAATAFEAKRDGIRVVGVTVDHGLQAGSADQAARVVAQMAALGADETATVRVTVDPGPAGIEAGAREARYEALAELAHHVRVERVLLGHTLDDQAETVLLGLARGSGGQSLQGMRRVFASDNNVVFSRPFLTITRAQTEAACRADSLEWWDDPQNDDPGFARVRVRRTVLPMLERELGPGIAAALARTGEQLRDDMDALAPHVRTAYERMAVEGGLDAAEMIDGGQPAIYTRVVRRAAVAAGAIESELTRAHVMAVMGILGRSGKEIQLPGHVTAYADGSLLFFKPTEPLQL